MLSTEGYFSGTRHFLWQLLRQRLRQLVRQVLGQLLRQLLTSFETTFFERQIRNVSWQLVHTLFIQASLYFSCANWLHQKCPKRVWFKCLKKCLKSALSPPFNLPRRMSLRLGRELLRNTFEGSEIFWDNFWDNSLGIFKTSSGQPKSNRKCSPNRGRPSVVWLTTTSRQLLWPLKWLQFPA